jgi:hypothetical protein
VNEHFQIVEGPIAGNVSIDKISLHHYVLKSEAVRPACIRFVNVKCHGLRLSGHLLAVVPC